jgi:hypothetical protein
VSHPPRGLATIVWLAASAGAATALVVLRLGIARAAQLGLAAGLLFAAGDVSAKLISFGGIWLLALLSLVAAYATGTGVLQGAFQHGSALTAAGLATLVTNAVPIAAGFALDEALPSGAGGSRSPRSPRSSPAALLGLAAARSIPRRSRHGVIRAPADDRARFW